MNLGIFSENGGLNPLVFREEEWKSLAALAARFLPDFGLAVGVGAAGDLLADALCRGAATSRGEGTLVICQFHYSESMTQAMEGWLAKPGVRRIIGLCVVGTEPVPSWVLPLYRTPQADEFSVNFGQGNLAEVQFGRLRPGGPPLDAGHRPYTVDSSGTRYKVVMPGGESYSYKNAGVAKDHAWLLNWARQQRLGAERDSGS